MWIKIRIRQIHRIRRIRQIRWVRWIRWVCRVRHIRRIHVPSRWIHVLKIAREISKLQKDNCYTNGKDPYILRNLPACGKWNISASLVFSRSSCPEVFCRKGVLRNFAKFTVKHLCQILFFDKVAGLRIFFSQKKKLLNNITY